MCIPNSLGRIHAETEHEKEKTEWTDGWKAGYWMGGGPRKHGHDFGRMRGKEGET